MCVPYVSALEINESPMIICPVRIFFLGATCTMIRWRIVILAGAMLIGGCVLMALYLAGVGYEINAHPHNRGQDTPSVQHG